MAEAADVEARICGVSATVARVLGPDTLSLLLPEGVLVGECAVEVLPARLRASPLAGAMTARAALEVLEPRPKITLLRPKLLGAAGGSTVTVFGAFFPPVFAKVSVDVRLGDRPAYVQDLVVSDARDTVLIVQLPPSDALGAATLRVTIGGIAVSVAVLVSDLRASLACRPVQTAVSFGPALAGAAVRVFSAPAPGCEDPAQPCASLLLETTAGAAPLLLTAGRYIFEFSGARGARLTVAQGVHGPALLLELALPAGAGARALPAHASAHAPAPARRFLAEEFGACAVGAAGAAGADEPWAAQLMLTARNLAPVQSAESVSAVAARAGAAVLAVRPLTDAGQDMIIAAPGVGAQVLRPPPGGQLTVPLRIALAAVAGAARAASAKARSVLVPMTYHFPPAALEARIDGRGASLRVLFDADTDRGGARGKKAPVAAVPCEDMLNLTAGAGALLGAAPRCAWASARELEVRFGAGALALPGDELLVTLPPSPPPPPQVLSGHAASLAPY